MKELPKTIGFKLWILNLAYFLLVIFPYLVFGFSYIPGIISIPDLIDLALYPFVIGLILYTIFTHLVRREDSILIRYLFMFLLILHIEGHGFHWAANALNVTIEHTTDVPESLYNYAYFLDEHLSHWLTFYTFFGILMYFLLVSIIKNRDEEAGKYWLVNQIMALIFGFGLIVSGIEGQVPYETIAAGIILLMFPIILLKKNIKRMFKERTVVSYLFSTGLWIIIFASIYWLIFQGFPQPSEWM